MRRFMYMLAIYMKCSQRIVWHACAHDGDASVCGFRLTDFCIQNNRNTRMQVCLFQHTGSLSYTHIYVPCLCDGALLSSAHLTHTYTHTHTKQVIQTHTYTNVRDDRTIIDRWCTQVNRSTLTHVFNLKLQASFSVASPEDSIVILST